MSGTLDLLNAQNLSRAQAVVGAATLANRSFASANVSGAGRAALAGSAITSLGNILSGFQSRRRTGDGFKINDFTSRINKLGGLAHTSNFLVSIQAPECMRVGTESGINVSQPNPSVTTNEVPAVGRANQELKQTLNGIADNLLFLCSATAIPGIQIQTTDIQPYGYGAIERRPTNAFFNSLRMNYYVDVSSTVYQFFTKWISCIVNFNDSAIGSRTSSEGAFYNEVGYKASYATTITIYVYDSAGNNFLEVKLKDAFPIEVGQVNLTWGNYNSLAVLPINISYQNWVSNYTPISQISASGLRNLTLASALLRAGTLVQGASLLSRRPRNIADTFNLVNNASLLRNTLFR